MLTVDDAKKWVAEHETELEAARLACEDCGVVLMNHYMPEIASLVWCTGSWLGEQFTRLGMPEEEKSDALAAAGQWSAAMCPWQAVVDAANHYAEHGVAKDKSGPELGHTIYEYMINSESGESKSCDQPGGEP